MEHLYAAKRWQASRARHQQHSSDQGSRRMASYGHHGAGRVGHCAAAQGISPVKSSERHGDLRRCSALSTGGSNMNPSAVTAEIFIARDEGPPKDVIW